MSKFIETDDGLAFDPSFNPYEKDMIEKITTELLQLRQDIVHWFEIDIKSLDEPLDLGPISLKFIEARIHAADDAVEALDTVIANINAIVKITELLGEWRDWWSAQ